MLKSNFDSDIACMELKSECSTVLESVRALGNMISLNQFDNGIVAGCESFDWYEFEFNDYVAGGLMRTFRRTRLASDKAKVLRDF